MTPASPIKRDGIDTVRDGNRSDAAAPTGTAAASTTGQNHSAVQGPAERLPWQYGAPMAHTTAAAIAAALRTHLRERNPYLPDRKLHALLYLTQMLWLAVDDDPLFPEPIHATEEGVQVSADVSRDHGGIGDPYFGHVVFAAGRYGGLSAMDLEALIRGQGLWAQARATENKVIDLQCLRQFIRDQEDIPEGTLLGWTRSARKQMRTPGREASTNSQNPDSPAEIEAFVAEVRAGM